MNTKQLVLAAALITCGSQVMAMEARTLVKDSRKAQVAPLSTIVNINKLSAQEIAVLTGPSALLAAYDRAYCEHSCIPKNCIRAKAISRGFGDASDITTTCSNPWHPIADIIEQPWFNQQANYCVNVGLEMLHRVLHRTNAIIKTNYHFQLTRKYAALFNTHKGTIIEHLTALSLSARAHCVKATLSGAQLIALETALIKDETNKISIPFLWQDTICSVAEAIVIALLADAKLPVEPSDTVGDWFEMSGVPQESTYDFNMRMITIRRREFYRSTGDPQLDRYFNIKPSNAVTPFVAPPQALEKRRASTVAPKPRPTEPTHPHAVCSPGSPSRRK